MRASILTLAFASFTLTACSGQLISDGDVVGGPGDPSSSSSPKDPAPESSSSTPARDQPVPLPPKDPDPAPPPKTKTPTPIPASAGPPPTAAECAAFAATYCAKGVSCGAADVTLYGASCETHIAAECNARAAAPGSGLMAAALATCKAAFATSAKCSDGFQGPYRLCNVLGFSPLDADCVYDEQCASGYCQDKSSGCGLCAPAPAYWNGPYQETVGASCDYNLNQCNTALGLWCGFSTDTCGPIKYVGAAEECLFVNGNDLALCEPGLACKSIGGSTGVCIKAKALGEACVAASGWEVCEYGTTCIDNVCAYRTPATLCK